MLTLVIPSASNLDESNIKHAKVFNMIVKIYLNGEFIEVPLSSSYKDNKNLRDKGRISGNNAIRWRIE